MLLKTYYAQNYASIIGLGLSGAQIINSSNYFIQDFTTCVHVLIEFSFIKKLNNEYCLLLSSGLVVG